MVNMDQRANFLALILLDALEDENESDVYGILERNNVDPSYVPRERGIAPMHYVCGMQNKTLALAVVTRFLAGGANPNVRSAENMTPLHVAAMYGRLEIVKLLLKYEAQLNSYDDERKTPVHYAIEECHFEVVLLMRDHLFEGKYKQKQIQQQEQQQQNGTHSTLTHSKFEQSLQSRVQTEHTCTPNSPVNKHLLAISNENDAGGANNSKYTPNRVHYNYDVTSPYYIHITHRRHKPQPLYPAVQANDNNVAEAKDAESNALPEITTEPVNIFTLTQENLRELSQLTPSERSRISLIETWREKVQISRARQSILKEYDDINEMIENVMENEHLNFTNTVLRDKGTKQADKPTTTHELDKENEACGSAAISLQESTKYVELPKRSKPSLTLFGNVLQKVAQAQLAQPDAESSYQTVPEITSAPNDTSNFIRSPNSNEYFLQMTEGYVHTDNENGLVFYETKLLSNPVNNVQSKLNPKQEQANVPQNPQQQQQQQLNTTVTSQSTNYTIPADYETDALRAELTTFGQPPGPITKNTKRLYIKRLVKYKRQTARMMEQEDKYYKYRLEIKLRKFSIELYRTVRLAAAFENITADYAKYEKESRLYFAEHKQKNEMREGHLKQSFIYMLIDPRISCNLPGDSVFIDKFEAWKRFLQSIFYVGKGKTSRPYSHLYDAMKAHSRMHNLHTNNEKTEQGKKISIKKQSINIELFKSPPKESSANFKLDRILEIWGNNYGVVCLHVFHNIVPIEAYTREAAIIDALGLRHLTNVKRGDYYGPARSWSMREKKFLGIALLHKAMQIFLAEGESQLSPSDLI